MAFADTTSLVEAAATLKTKGHLGAALRLIVEEGDLSDPAVDDLHLRSLMALEDYPALQSALIDSIDRLADPRPPREPAHLQLLLNFSETACLGPERLRTLLDLTRELAREDHQLGVSWRGAERRQTMRILQQERIEGAATLISLGRNCMPWVLLNRWGMRTPDEFSRLLTPFALAVHKVKGVVRALSSDFTDYFEPSALRTVETEKGHRIAVRKDLSALWNHNRGPYWLDNDFAALRGNLESKVGNFRTASRADNAVFLMSKSPAASEEHSRAVLGWIDEALAAFTGRTGNRIILFNEAAEARALRQLTPTAAVIDCPYPDRAYTWFDPADENTAAGLDFERSCVSAVTRALMSWGLLRWSRTTSGIQGDVMHG